MRPRMGLDYYSVEDRNESAAAVLLCVRCIPRVSLHSAVRPGESLGPA